MTRRVATAVASLAAGLALASAAVAAPPTRSTDSIDYSGSSSCGAFNDMYEGHLDISGITTVDRDGNALRDVIVFAGEGVTIHGPHDIFDQGDAAFCNALLAIS
jgi:uncharacterized membrane protein